MDQGVIKKCENYKKTSRIKEWFIILSSTVLSGIILSMVGYIWKIDTRETAQEKDIASIQKKVKYNSDKILNINDTLIKVVNSQEYMIKQLDKISEKLYK